MKYIETIPDFNEKLRDPIRLAPEIPILMRSKDNKTDEEYSYEVINTKININDIENIISKVLNKHSDICKYYINIDESYWGVSFNIGNDQTEIMCQTMFEIKLYKDVNDCAVICLTKEISEFQQWSDIYKSLLYKLKHET
jgi:hypothetical protein